MNMKFPSLGCVAISYLSAGPFLAQILGLHVVNRPVAP